MKSKTIYLGLGSNVGNRSTSILNAIKELKSKIDVQVISPVYETEPYGYQEQEKFLNACIKAETTLSPLELLDFIKETEKKLGREKTFHWGPRVIDIDILLYASEIINSEQLQVPHPDMQNRKFVLQPLADIAGEVIHPVLQKSINSINFANGL